MAVDAQRVSRFCGFDSSNALYCGENMLTRHKIVCSLRQIRRNGTPSEHLLIAYVPINTKARRIQANSLRERTKGLLCNGRQRKGHGRSKDVS